MVPEAPLPVGAAVTVTVPVLTSVPVAVIELVWFIVRAALLLDQSEAVLAVKETVPADRLTELPLVHDVHVTVVAVCPTVTGTEPLIVPSVVVAVIVIALVVIEATADILPLLFVLFTATIVSSEELQFTELVKFLVLPSSLFPVAINWAEPLAERFGAVELAHDGQVTVMPVNVGLTKNPLQLIAPASSKSAATAPT